jgi:hypothetical protein
MKRNSNRQPAKKKKANVFSFSILDFFALKDPFKKMMWSRKCLFMKDLALIIVKNYLPLQFVESVWLKCLVLHLCPCVQFPSRQFFFTQCFI